MQRFFGARACTQPHGGFAWSRCYCHHTAPMVCPTSTASSLQLKARPPHLGRRPGPTAYPAPRRHVPISVKSIPTSAELTPTLCHVDHHGPARLLPISQQPMVKTLSLHNLLISPDFKFFSFPPSRPIGIPRSLLILFR